MFDAIVIGSGIGGLSFAALMARLRHWRVLILERHFKIGGFTHTFSRPGGWTWDVGVHYVGEMEPGRNARRLFDFVTGGALDWAPMPDIYDVFVYPDLIIRVPKGRTNFERALAEVFPAERGAIRQYFRDIKGAADWFARRIAATVAPQPFSALVSLINRWSRQAALQTTQQYMERNIRDPRLRAVLCSQWADYGLPPSRSAFVTHAVIATHYLDGAWYPAGGAGEIAKTISSVIRGVGGELWPSHEVTRIVVENGRAVGVEVATTRGGEHGRMQFRAPVVVSDAGAWNTFTRLLPRETAPFRSELQHDSAEGMEAVELFLGLKRDPRAMGLQGENYWLFSGFEHDRICAQRDDLLNGRASMAYISFPSVKDPKAKRHTAEIIAPFPYRALEQFRNETWLHRGPEYEAAKERITQGLLDLVDRQFPNFRELIAHAELATPVTFEHFTAAPSGTIYGYPATPERFRNRWLAPRTPIRNLYLTGTDVSLLGVMGALMGGVVTAGLLLGPAGFFEIMRAARSPARATVAAAPV